MSRNPVEIVAEDVERRCASRSHFVNCTSEIASLRRIRAVETQRILQRSLRVARELRLRLALAPFGRGAGAPWWSASPSRRSAHLREPAQLREQSIAVTASSRPEGSAQLQIRFLASTGTEVLEPRDTRWLFGAAPADRRVTARGTARPTRGSVGRVQPPRRDGGRAERVADRSLPGTPCVPVRKRVPIGRAGYRDRPLAGWPASVFAPACSALRVVLLVDAQDRLEGLRALRLRSDLDVERELS